MKQKTFIFVLLLLSTLTASAQTLIDGIYYNLIPKMKQAEVTNVSGNYYSGDIEIPSTVTYEDVEYTVTSIKASAFLWCEELKSITIPNTVKTIGESAFYKCTYLNVVKIGTGVKSIGDDAFQGDLRIRNVTIYDFEAWCNIEFGNSASNPTLYGQKLFLNGEEITDPVIPQSVTSIGDYAFTGCKYFTSITIPNTVTSIGRSAFERCNGIKTVSIPGSVTTIRDYAFDECTGLTSLTISNGVQSIGTYAFGNCKGVTSLSIPNSVTSIGNDAFVGCAGLTSVTFGNGLKTIGDYAFLECISLQSANIPEGVTWIRQGAFKGCSAISTITIPSSVRELDPETFAGCPNLSNVYCYAEELPYTKRNALNWETTIIGDLFKDSYIEYATLYVTENAIDAYKENETWNGFGTILPIGDEPAAEGIAINETNFPDKNFRNYLLSQNYGQDGVLTVTELKMVNSMDVSNKEIQSLKGIEHFTSLTTLYCYSNQISRSAMDELIDCLPTVSSGELYSIFNENEGNMMTPMQVTSAKEKNWTPYYYDGSNWQEYAGEKEKCATPTIANVDGKLMLTCETEDVEYACNVGFKNDGNILSLPKVVTISICATKEGYEPSDVLTKEIDMRVLIGIIGDVNEDGIVNGTDIQEVINIIVGN